MSGHDVRLSPRDRALLHAVDAGRCDLARPGPADLRIDGRWFCDQIRARVLLAAGLLTAGDGGAGRVPAVLTASGRIALLAV